ncbi:stress responsive alpha-beta barrel domain-containing protein (plasmid) [Pararhizobium polonicum]|uniref:Stress responsive alpha-beta barrel domain-containing protein n=1 Tax=Pararhizobium polonicum TaxID=1612624 RepID=A0A1C7P8V7_9HYPH|nr:Dabb family protein [Pararhizobium polonicum]OBZ97600.1 stress responsive alpha-beta barrel domain-containing protein [Pararhizobium polonicum]
MIRHTVAFTLKHPPGSVEEREFLEAALALAEISTVRKFEQLRQTSPKNKFAFGFSMEFEDQAAFDVYNDHPIHQAFVRERWQGEVSTFMETDYVPL